MLASAIRRPPSRSPPTYDPHSTRCTAGCHTSRDFVHWRFLDAGQLSLRTVSLLPASKNQNTTRRHWAEQCASSIGKQVAAPEIINGEVDAL